MCLGTHAQKLKTKLGSDVDAMARCIFAGDFNLAPNADLKPSPMRATGGRNAFADLNSAGWRAANLAHTNLPALAASDDRRCRDNFFVHDALCNSHEPKYATAVLTMQLGTFKDGTKVGSNAFVVHFDELLVAEANKQGVTREWLSKGFTAVANNPLDFFATLLTNSEPDGSVAAGEEASRGSGGGSAAHGVCQLGLFDHCFSFIDVLALQ